MAVAKELYNEQAKIKFLEDGDFTEGTKRDYKRVLALAHHVEVALDKDLYEFNSVEIEKVLYDMKVSSFRSLEKNGWIISSYLNWAIENNLRNNSNPLANVGSKFFQKFVYPEKLIYTEDEVHAFEAGCVNPQDSVILTILFEVGGGSNEYEEIRNLRVDDIDFDNRKLTLRNDSGEVTRIVEVSKYCIEQIQDAIDQEQYAKRNGQAKESTNIRNYTTLDRTDYVIRRSLEGVEPSNAPVIPAVIYRRIKVIQETLGVKNLTAKKIQKSGEIYEGYKVLKRDGSINIEDIKQIAKQFGRNEQEAYRMKSYINKKTIGELYTL